MKQIELMDKAIDGIGDTHPSTFHIGRLREVLEDTRNPPPQGESDGTVDERQWRLALKVAHAAEVLHLSLNQWEEMKESDGRREPPESA